MANISRVRNVRIFILFFILIELFILLPFVSADRTEIIPGFFTHDTVLPNESVEYIFPNNITFEISTDSYTELELQFENRIENRHISFSINNTNPLSLNVSSRETMQSFGITSPPQGPQRSDTQFRYRYNCIFRIQLNTTLNNLTIRSKKDNQLGLNSDNIYTLVLYGGSHSNWDAIDTLEKLNGSDSELYLESSLTNIQADTEYYITYFEVLEGEENWFWLFLIIPGALAIIALAILISKPDYFQYLRTRTISIERGAHRMSLDDVLENENRNKIIDLILKEPGIHFNELLRRTELAAGNLVWHLDILETYKVIGKKRISNFVAYFPYYQKNPLSNVDLKLTKSKLTLEILEMIEKEPGLWNNLITKRLKVDHKTIRYHLEKLNDLNLIRFRTDGRKKKIFPNLDSDYFNKNSS
jgi:predicted transcriptional regulator